jgi:RNA methyltransferase, TrmH family
MPDLLVTSRQNERVKAAAKLRERKGRDAQQRFLIDGRREIGRAISAGVPIVELWVSESFASETACAELVEKVRSRQGEVLRAIPPVIEKLAFGEREEGIVAVARTARLSLDGLELPVNSLVAVLDGVEKPGNVGAIFRTADAAGVDAFLLSDPRTDLFNPNCIRASVGSLFAVPAAVASASDIRHWLRERGIHVYAARVDAGQLYTEVDYRGPTAIVLGSEATGLDETWSGEDVIPIRLPMRGSADSLNVSVAAGVLIYEARRQRGE